jgi:catechol 2,3-dioxygenase-like lactoylglutathione lyase family enzyme
MLGSFLEFGVAARDIRESFAFYEQLGFEAAITGDIWSHPYGVLVHGTLALGLHARLATSPALTFVKADVARLARLLEERGIELTLRRLGGESFNEIGFEDASGCAVRVLEARTYSPPPPVDAPGWPLGHFDLLSLPARDPEAALAFWRALDWAVASESLPWEREVLGFGRLRVAFHPERLDPGPVLAFRTPSLAASIARCAEIAVAPRVRGLRPFGPEHAVLDTPDDLALLLYEDPG